MKSIKSVHTVNARDNVFLEVTRDYFNLSPERMHREIQGMRKMVEDALALKGIRYDDLKTALVPDRKRKEIALVFDSTAIDSYSYGPPIYEQVLPLFHKASNHAVLTGDYIDTGAGEETLYKAMQNAMQLVRNIDYKHSSQFFIMYINNLSLAMFDKFYSGLRDFEPFIGFADTTFSSPFKTLISTMLPQAFLKHRNLIVQGHPDDVPNSENQNMMPISVEKFGYKNRSIQSILEGTLLNYKIERPVFKGLEVDTEFALNAISATPLALDTLDIDVKADKIEYLKKFKSGSLQKARLQNLTVENLKKLIAAKISESYIYNLSYDPEYGVAKFNIILELPQGGTKPPVRLLGALAYEPSNKLVRLLTFY